MRTALTDALQISIPVIQAPMAGGADTAELVAAVSNAGAFGCIGAAYLAPDEIIERGRAVRAATPRPFGINLFAPRPALEVSDGAVQRATSVLAPYYAELGLEPPQPPRTGANRFEDQLAACLETGAFLFSFTFGMLPASAVAQVKGRGLLLMGTATTVEEAQALNELGVDAVVAQGSEAGGHRGTFLGDFADAMIGTMSLVPQVSDAVRVPVVASGGIMDGRGIAAALTLGAAAVQLGTAFLTCPEAGVPEAYKAAVASAGEDQTRITRAFSGRPARGIVNRFLLDMADNDEAVLPFPLQNTITRPLRNEAGRRNRAEFLSLWAGQGTRMARRLPAAELVRQLNAETETALARSDSLRN